MVAKIKKQLGKLSKKQIIFISCMILAVVLIAGITFSFYAQRKEGWQQKYDVSGLVFTLNDRNINSEEKSLTYTLARKEEVDVPMKVAVKGSTTGSFAVKYNIDWTLDETSKTLSHAIEVYRLEDEKYVYVDMLDHMLDNISEGEHFITGYIGPDDDYTYDYKLVYSAGAGSEYENQTFTMDVTATYTTETDSNNYYITNLTDHKGIAASADAKGKNLILLNDITLDGNISFVSAVSLDINGKNLNLAGYDMTFPDAAEYDGTKPPLQFVNSKSTGAVSGSGKVIFNTPRSVYYIDDKFAEDTHISVTGYSLSALFDVLKNNLEKTSENDLRDGDVIEFTQGEKAYFSSVATSVAILSYSNGDGILTAGTGENTGKFIVSALDNTKIFDAQFSLNKSGEPTQTLNASFTLVGKSPEAYAQYLMDNVPDVINSSLFLSDYDSVTKSHITWVTSNSELLTKGGIFVKDGYETLDSWVNQKIKLGVIVETDGERSYAEKEVTVCILTPQERTELIYKYVSMTLETEGGNIDLSNAKYLDTTFAHKAGFENLSVSVDTTQTDSNVNYDKATGQYYITATDSIVTLNKRPTGASAVVVPSKLSFSYSDYEGQPYVIDRNIIAVGEIGTYTFADPTIELQVPFTTNDYVNGNIAENLVTNLNALQYLDELTYLNAGNTENSVNSNDITDLSPLQYLEKIQYLDLLYNNNLKDISALDGYMKLKYLRVFQNGGNLSGANSQYILTLIAANNTANGIKIYNQTATTDTKFDASARAAAQALSQLVEVNETYNTLYLPNNYTYNGQVYQLRYYTADKDYIKFTPETTGDTVKPVTTGYEITSPIVDKNIDIQVFIRLNGETDANEMKYCRQFTINLLQLKKEDKLTYI